MRLHVRLLEKQDIPEIAGAFGVLGWQKPASMYEHYLAEQEAGQRTVFVAFWNGLFAGYITVNWQPEYPPFRDAKIPEIQDFNVLPHLRRRGIGNRLMEECEQAVAERTDVVGIAVGLFADYGAAQRMYTRRGYILDGRGLMYHEKPVPAGQQVMVDHDLTLFFTKQLRG
jgi:GNAT superfamily N-acetyltransferase